MFRIFLGVMYFVSFMVLAEENVSQNQEEEIQEKEIQEDFFQKYGIEIGYNPFSAVYGSSYTMLGGRYFLNEDEMVLFSLGFVRDKSLKSDENSHFDFYHTMDLKMTSFLVSLEYKYKVSDSFYFSFGGEYQYMKKTFDLKYYKTESHLVDSYTSSHLSMDLGVGYFWSFWSHCYLDFQPLIVAWPFYMKNENPFKERSFIEKGDLVDVSQYVDDNTRIAPNDIKLKLKYYLLRISFGYRFNF